MGVRFTHIAFGAAALFPWTVATSGWAQTWAVSFPTPVNLGKVAMPNLASTFTLHSDGTSVTQTGSGVFVGSPAPTTRALVTVSCGNQSQCNGANVKIVITRTTPITSPASTLTNFTVAMGTATLNGPAPSAASSVTFTIKPVPQNGSRTFYVGMDMPVLSSGTSTGLGSASWIVTASAGNGTLAVNNTSLAQITSMRPMSVSKSLDLAFGSIVKPPSGSGSVTMDATGGFTSMPAGAVAIKTHSAAQFFVFGEGAQTFDLSVTPTFTMVSGVNSLPVTTVSSTGSQTLGAAIGAQGSFSLGVGGSFPLGSATPSGAYTGSFTVTATYN
jgi:hypothetical protein